MLNAQEANRELQAHLDYWKGQGREPKFSLCIYVDKGVREQNWNLPPDSKENWRRQWQDFDI